MSWMFWKKKGSAPPAVSQSQIVSIVTRLFTPILDNRPDDLDTTLAGAGVDARHRAFYVQLALATLDTLLSKDEDKQSQAGMIAALGAKDIHADLARALLSAASTTMLNRDKASS